jgi:tetratricopeptide (TPR) repeat protein
MKFNTNVNKSVSPGLSQSLSMQPNKKPVVVCCIPGKEFTPGFFDSWTKGYGPLYLGITYKNLGDIDNSFKMYNHAIQYAEESHFDQVKAKALTGLGELYRIQEKYETALGHHFDSIEILDKIGAKCDLAEAYFQLALTYQAMGDQPNGKIYFDKALDLWGPKQINAPEQIKRVKNAMQITFA